MSEFVQCPTCGKSTAVEHFHPEDLDLDIKLITMKGLGKGRGFEVVNRRSALEDAEVDVIEPIKNRTLDILKILIQSGYLTLDKVEEFLNEERLVYETGLRLVEELSKLNQARYKTAFGVYNYV